MLLAFTLYFTWWMRTGRVPATKAPSELTVDELLDFWEDDRIDLYPTRRGCQAARPSTTTEPETPSP